MTILSSNGTSTVLRPERYLNEIHDATKVLDGVLEGKQYLVGDKAYAAWMDRLLASPAVKKALEDKAKASQP
ncbi:hypothetical protein HYALB_00014072 [Hymenoscyphus albidus]|uniref:Uncharacterized protein n=1 Tax=Hymenoscyphus albidus TaxID=595503 RepID=A0A9N9LWV7_9HELO|nr:hypothetical protein HYALB_00014072 [Hymenoscyphus albidus]